MTLTENNALHLVGQAAILIRPLCDMLGIGPDPSGPQQRTQLARLTEPIRRVRQAVDELGLDKDDMDTSALAQLAHALRLTEVGGKVGELLADADITGACQAATELDRLLVEDHGLTPVTTEAADAVAEHEKFRAAIITYEPGSRELTWAVLRYLGRSITAYLPDAVELVLEPHAGGDDGGRLVPVAIRYADGTRGPIEPLDEIDDAYTAPSWLDWGTLTGYAAPAPDDVSALALDLAAACYTPLDTQTGGRSS